MTILDSLNETIKNYELDTLMKVVDEGMFLSVRRLEDNSQIFGSQDDNMVYSFISEYYRTFILKERY